MKYWKFFKSLSCWKMTTPVLIFLSKAPNQCFEDLMIYIYSSLWIDQIPTKEIYWQWYSGHGKKMFLSHLLMYGSSLTWNANLLTGSMVFLIYLKTSFMNSDDKLFLTLKISAKRFCRFLWWMFKDLSSVTNSLNDGLKSL